jgi:hypothetical protein
MRGIGLTRPHQPVPRMLAGIRVVDSDAPKVQLPQQSEQGLKKGGAGGGVLGQPRLHVQESLRKPVLLFVSITDCCHDEARRHPLLTTLGGNLWGFDL